MTRPSSPAVAIVDLAVPTAGSSVGLVRSPTVTRCVMSGLELALPGVNWQPVTDSPSHVPPVKIPIATSTGSSSWVLTREKTQLSIDSPVQSTGRSAIAAWKRGRAGSG